MRPGKAPVTCIPCARRKVRCNKEYPCVNCKRRPQDVCAYPSPASTPDNRTTEELGDRVARLESVIRNLGGDPSSLDQQTLAPSPASVASSKTSKRTQVAQTPASGHPAPFEHGGLLAQDEEATYLESPMWYSWGETKLIQGETPGVTSRRHQLYPTSSSSSGYIPTILDPVEPQAPDHLDPWCSSAAHLDISWSIFLKNVHPVVKVFFDWEIEQVIERAKHGENRLSAPEAALVSAIRLIAAVSIPEEDCKALLDREKATLLAHLQQATEISLRLAGFAVTSNKLTVQAFMLYLQAIRSRAHPAALFSLVGVASRVAERMGLHRDGEILGLSVLRSEERRRIWWQLQYMELTVANQVGTLSPSVLGKWDAKLPANIDDIEIGPGTKTLPPERPTLTGMSNCLWKYNVLQFHRAYRNGDRGLPTTGETTSMVDEIEKMLRVKFVQHCELLNPLHANMHLGICQSLVATQRLMRQPALVNAKISDMSRQQRDELLEICLKNLDYCILIQTSEPLKGFTWHNSAFFPWAAFIYVLLEVNTRSEEAEVKGIWRTVSRTYETHDELRRANHRQDVSFAARIVASAWQRHQLHLQGQDPKRQEPHPQWITDIYKAFNLPQPASDPSTTGSQAQSASGQALEMEFDLDLDMIDWSAWDGAYMDAGLFVNPPSDNLYGEESLNNSR